ncbi:hypothetical protein MBLNU459_g2141t1 [Dothideomycetes sp. NU459]
MATYAQPYYPNAPAVPPNSRSNQQMAFEQPPYPTGQLPQLQQQVVPLPIPPHVQQQQQQHQAAPMAPYAQSAYAQPQPMHPMQMQMQMPPPNPYLSPYATTPMTPNGAYPLGEPYAQQQMRPSSSSRQSSHRSARSHRSSHSHSHSHRSSDDDEDDTGHKHREHKRHHHSDPNTEDSRPTLGDSLYLIWDSVVGRFTGSKKY